MTEAVLAWVGIGSNLVDPARQVLNAFRQIDSANQTRVLQRSSLYHSKPMGPPGQPAYVNAVAGIETTLSPVHLLDELQRCENESGRVRTERWGPRTLDLDLLLFGDQMLDTERLVVPHPGIRHRTFVLVPLLELAPDIVIPGLGLAADWLATAEDFGVRKMESDHDF